MNTASWPFWAQLAKEFQTSISALAGFTGVVITLLVNARNIRRAKAREIEHQRQVLREAIRSELITMRDELRRRAKALSNHGKLGELRQPFSAVAHTLVYRSLLSQIGLLPHVEAWCVTSAYAALHAFEGSEKAAFEAEAAFHPTPDQLLKLPQRWAAALERLQIVLTKIDLALTAFGAGPKDLIDRETANKLVKILVDNPVPAETTARKKGLAST